jgi:hypothetical protein
MNLITEFERKIENKNNFAEAVTLDDQEWHLALGIPTSRMAHVERERAQLQNNIKTKPE